MLVAALLVSASVMPAAAHPAGEYYPKKWGAVSQLYFFTTSVPDGEWRSRIRAGVAAWNNQGQPTQFGEAPPRAQGQFKVDLIVTFPAAISPCQRPTWSPTRTRPAQGGSSLACTAFGCYSSCLTGSAPCRCATSDSNTSAPRWIDGAASGPRTRRTRSGPADGSTRCRWAGAQGGRSSRRQCAGVGTGPGRRQTRGR